MIDAGEAAAAARRALRELHGAGHADVLAAVATGEAGEPALVVRLDVPDASYYLVPWRDVRGVIVIAQIDATSGALQSVAVLPA